MSNESPRHRCQIIAVAISPGAAQLVAHKADGVSLVAGLAKMGVEHRTHCFNSHSAGQRPLRPRRGNHFRERRAIRPSNAWATSAGNPNHLPRGHITKAKPFSVCRADVAEVILTGATRTPWHSKRVAQPLAAPPRDVHIQNSWARPSVRRERTAAARNHNAHARPQCGGMGRRSARSSRQRITLATVVFAAILLSIGRRKSRRAR